MAGITGKVQEIRIFSTILKTPDNKEMIVPNGLITSDVITNLTSQENRRIDLVIGVSYDDDIKLAKQIIEDTITARTPMARWGRPEELAGTALYLASPALAGFVTGVTIPVDGGYIAC